MKYGLSPIRTPNKDEENDAGYNDSKTNRIKNKSRSNVHKKTTKAANFLSPDFSLVQAFLYDEQEEEDIAKMSMMCKCANAVRTSEEA